MSSNNTTTIYATFSSVLDMGEEKDKKETIEIDKELYLSLIQGKKSAAEYNMSEEENKASYLGLLKVYAYYCMRCNHIWLPRFSSGYNPFDYNKLVLDSELPPPKSCAKCKSKSWLEIP